MSICKVFHFYITYLLYLEKFNFYVKFIKGHSAECNYIRKV